MLHDLKLKLFTRVFGVVLAKCILECFKVDNLDRIKVDRETVYVINCYE